MPFKETAAGQYAPAGNHNNTIAEPPGSFVAANDTQRIMTSLFRHTSSVRLVISKDFRVLFLNVAAENKSSLFAPQKLHPGDFLPAYLLRVFEPLNPGITQHFTEGLQQSLGGENVIKEIPVKIMVLAGQEAVLWFRVSTSPVWDKEDMLGISISVTDINHQKKQELFIRRQNEALREIIFAQSHEVRGPLTNILAIANMIEELTGNPIDAELASMLKEASQQLDCVVKKVVIKAAKWKLNEPA
ncbi:hypothetical protein [Foetidibacter luteolus]|uniref:hypothetical protein n=1 Tax=Foetidibacter luteolus TaxID=2608880 RepID=UPI00129BE1C7|nr:hypothetical protein [Foetidibacter luteolus]